MKAFDEFAKEVLEQVNNENNALHGRKIALETELAEINEKMALIKPKKERATIYKAEQMSCPFCFIHKNLSIEMKPIPSESENDFFRCHDCSSEIEVKN